MSDYSDLVKEARADYYAAKLLICGERDHANYQLANRLPFSLMPLRLYKQNATKH